MTGPKADAFRLEARAWEDADGVWIFWSLTEVAGSRPVEWVCTLRRTPRRSAPPRGPRQDRLRRSYERFVREVLREAAVEGDWVEASGKEPEAESETLP